MLTEKEIQDNKIKYINLINTITNIKDKTGLINKLESLNFFNACGFTKNYYNYKGGLVEFILKIYDNLIKINKITNNLYDEGTIKQVALLSQVARCDYNKSYLRNVKVDNIWEQKEEFTLKNNNERTIIGIKGVDSYLMIKDYCSLDNDSLIAILNQYDGTKEVDFTIKLTIAKCPLIMLLNCAIQMSIYL